MLTAGELSTRDVAVARRGETLLEAAQRMRDEHVGALVVVDEGARGPIPVGILTDRDIIVSVLARTDRHLHTVLVGDVMTETVVVAHLDEPLVDAIARMSAAGVRRLPVVDQHGLLEGIISFDDVIGRLAAQVGELVTLLRREQRREAATRR